MRIYRSLCLFLTAVCILTSCQSPSKTEKPNIILIMTDDQGYGDIAAHGNPWIKTPEMDKLHGESVRFTDFHVGTTCSPTRAGLMTGRNCNEVGAWHTIIGRNFLRQGEVTIADVLQENDYATGMFGKWHLGDNVPYLPHNRGFDQAVYHGGGGVGQTPDYWNNDYFDDTYFRNGVPEKFEGYCTDIWFDEALKFIEANKEGPFFTYIATNAPHGPFHVPQSYIDMYNENEEVPNANFYGMITNIDENLGRLRAKLEALNISDNTILVFMTDNGTSGGIQLNRTGFKTGKGFNAGMRGKKGSAYEGGHRVPLFVHWPDGGLAHGKDVDFITGYTDIVPTLLDLCGIEYQPKLPYEGESLANLLKNPADPWKSRTLITDTQREEFLVKWKDASIMTEDYRLIRGEELYAIKTDPGQKEDIAAENEEIVEQLRKEYETWWKRVAKHADVINPIPVGFDSSTVTLTCHDIHADSSQSPAWHQNHVRLNRNPNGFWIIDVKTKGRYQIALHRYARESQTGLSASVPLGDDIDGGNPAPEGVAISPIAAKVQIGEQAQSAAVNEGALNAVFEMDLEPGEQKLQTWLNEEDGGSTGAYYVYVKML